MVKKIYSSLLSLGRDKLRKALILGAVVGLSSTLSYAQLSGTKTINPSGSGANNYTTFQAAVTALSSQGVNGPVTFEVSPGTYTERITISNIPGTSPTNRVIFKSSTGNQADVRLRFNNGTGDNWVLRIQDADYITFRDMSIQSLSTTYNAAVAIRIIPTSNSADATGIEFRNCLLTSQWFVAEENAAIWTTGNTPQLKVKGCTIGQTKGISFYGISTSVLSNDIEIDSNTFNVQTHASGSGTSDAFEPILIRYFSNIKIRGNNFTKSGCCADDLIQILDSKNGGEISNNRAYFSGGNGILISNFNPQTTDNNPMLIYNNNFATAYAGYVIRLTSSRAIHIYNNNIFNNANPGGGIEGISVTGAQGGIRIVNNIIQANNGAPLVIPNNVGNITEVNFNNYFSNGPIARINGSDYNNLNSLRGVISNNPTNDSASYNVVPGFPNVNNLTPTAKCLLGKNVGIGFDINGTARPSTPSLGSIEPTYGTNDIGVAEILSPSFPISAGQQDLIVRVQNYGSNNISTADISYILNSGTPVVQNLPSALGQCQSINIQFTGSNQINVNPGSNTLRVFTSNPNGGTDANTSNDEINIGICTPLNGTYSIGAGGDFASINAAVNAINCGGVSGPVVFNVLAGTYSGFISLSSVPGISRTNNIKFIGAGANSTTIDYNNLNPQSNAVVYLNKTPHVSFENIRFRRPTTSSSSIIHLTNSSDSILVKNCILEYISPTTSFSAVGILAGTAPNSQNGAKETEGSLFENNTIINAGTGVGLYSNNTFFIRNNTIRNNTFQNIGNYGIYVYYGYNTTITNNTLFGGGMSYGIYSFFSNSNKMNQNTIRNCSISGMYVYFENYTGFGVGTSEIYNNMVSVSSGNSTTYGIYAYYAYNSKFYHNSVINNSIYNGTAGVRASLYMQYGSNNDIKNNIFDIRTNSGVEGYSVWRNNINNANFNHNTYFANTNNHFNINGTNRPRLSDWQSFENFYNQNSRFEQVPFISFTDLHIPNTFDAPSGDNSLNVLIDRDGDARCVQAPTIGADENKFPNPPPFASFAAPDTVYENSPAKFIQTTNGDPSKMAFTWLVDGIVQGVGQTFNFTAGGPGQIEVSMIAANCFGADTMIKVINVVSPTSSPVSDFVANKLVVNLFELVELTDISKFGPTQWQWSASPASDVSFTNEFDATTMATFTAPGLYEICLSTSNANGQGKDTCKKAYILVRDDVQMCNFNLTKATEGRLTDENGDLNYSTPAKNCSLLIDPCASSINLKFNFFEVADANDILRVYDGTSTSAPLLGQFTLGSGLPGGSNGLTATSGKMFITWTTNASGFARGFDAVWTSVPNGTPAPTADFTFPSTIYTGQTVEFISSSTGSNLTYEWDFDYPNFVSGINGGNVDRDMFSWTAAGTYQVKLGVTNCGGTSTIVKNIDVIDPASAPIVGFTADRTRIPVLSTVKFQDTSDLGPLNWRWEITPSITAIFQNGNTISNPEVRFFAPGNYDVKLWVENATGADSLIKTSYIEVYDYCIPAVANLNADLGISRVAFKNINNTSSIGQTPYTSYVNTLAPQSVGLGEIFNISIERNTTKDNMSRKVWIDWNIDGDFNDAGELAAFQTSTKDKSFNTAIYVPRTAVAGITRMRISTSYDNDNNVPCGINSVGEFEDYALEIIVDTEAPVITLLGSDTVYVEQWYSYVEPGFSAQDNVDGNITTWMTLTNNFDSSFVGTYFATYNVTDSANNSASVTRTIIVTDDVTPPSITLNGNAVDQVTVNTAYFDSSAVAIDYFNRNISSSIIITNNVDLSVVGSYQIIYDVTDGGGNSAQAIRTVNVVDDVAPTISLLGNDTVFVEVKTPYIEQGAIASDNYDQNVTVNISPSMINTSVTGSHIISYNAQDANGNIATTINRVVIVRDTERPLIKLVGLDTVIVDVFTDYNDKGVKVTDNYCNNLTAEADITPNTNRVGDYLITYNTSDCEGNNALPVSRVVRVVDRVAPVLQLKGVNSTTIIQRWQPYTDAGVNVSDNYYAESELLPLVQTSTNFRNDLEGDYEYCYDVVDPSGNRAQRVCRSIKVVANTTSVDKIEFGGTLTVYPVPTKGSLTLNLYLENEMNMDIVITNMLGQTVQNVYNGPVHQSEIKTDLSNLPAGMYFVRFTANGISTVRKIQVIN